jgi:hypothetical protein
MRSTHAEASSRGHPTDWIFSPGADTLVTSTIPQQSEAVLLLRCAARHTPYRWGDAKGPQLKACSAAIAPAHQLRMTLSLSGLLIALALKSRQNSAMITQLNTTFKLVTAVQASIGRHKHLHNSQLLRTASSQSAHQSTWAPFSTTDRPSAATAAAAAFAMAAAASCSSWQHANAPYCMA